MSDGAHIDWPGIARRLGVADAQALAERRIIPLIEGVPVGERDAKGAPKNHLELPVTVAFFAFVAAFMSLGYVLPDNLPGNIARFILFPVLFLAMIGASMFLFRDRFIAALTYGKERFIARSRALKSLAEELGLEYTPSPGGAPAALKFIARHAWSPAVLKDAAAVLDDHGGMDAPLAAARKSGAMMSDVAYLGSRDQKDKYVAQHASMQQVEDGFQGARNGVAFSAFEWVETVEDSPNIYHLVMVFDARRRLYGVTQLRTRHIAWPSAPEGVDLKRVGVVAPAFEERFRIRTNDQVEARAVFDPAVLERVASLAHGEKVRAVAAGEHLVIDVAGEDRFAMVDLATGAWSEATVAKTMTNIAEMLDLADAVADAFRLKAA